MKRTRRNVLADTLFLTGAAFLFLGCIASSYRSAQTLQEGQVSLGAGYLNAINMESSKSDGIDLFNIDARLSPGNGVDLGLTHTFDFTPDNDNAYATVWGDAKVQLTNMANAVGSLTLATGLMKGYAYHEDAKMHITSLPLIASYPLSDQFVPTLLYRHEFISDGAFPDGDSFKNPRSFVALGFEYAFKKPDHTAWTPKLGVSIGTFNSLTGGEGDRGLTINVGLTMDSPLRPTGL